MGIKTPLNTMSIALQDKRERNWKGLSKQNANVILPLVKGTKPPGLSQWAQQIQKFEKQMKMLKEKKNV